MAFRIQLPADFRWWRAALVVIGLGIPLVTFRLMGPASGDPLVLALLIAVACASFVGCAICLVTGTSGLWFRPFGRILDSLFHPAETITYPPADLLRALRERLRNRQWESVSQQLDALEKAYGRGSDLFYLRAHLAAGLSGDCKHITNAASHGLSGREFDRYLALLRRDPPVVYVESGADV